MVVRGLRAIRSDDIILGKSLRRIQIPERYRVKSDPIPCLYVDPGTTYSLAIGQARNGVGFDRYKNVLRSECARLQRLWMTTS
jgi:hypothetical protein